MTFSPEQWLVFAISGGLGVMAGIGIRMMRRALRDLEDR